MAIEHFVGNHNYTDMACHVFALSGDTTRIDSVNSRYQELGRLLFHGVSGDPAAVPAGLTSVTNRNILNAAADFSGETILRLLCAEFGLVVHPGTGVRIWGHFEEGQMLPEHMYVTFTNGKIYDTMPSAPVRRNTNNNGRNPPSNIGSLEPAVIYSVEVSALAAGTQAVIDTPDVQWDPGSDW